MKKRILRALAVIGLLALAFTGATDTAQAAPDGPVSIERPTDFSSNLAAFSCAVTKPDPDGGGPYTGGPSGSLTINHAHYIASASSPGHYDAFDCEGWVHVGLDGCVWRTWYIYDDNPSTGQDYGIFGPANITCWGFDGLRQSSFGAGAVGAAVQELDLDFVSSSRPAQTSPYDTPLPAYDVCGINMPHPSSDWLDEYYKSTTGDPHYSCIAKHPGSTHYYIVCHDKYANRWWWKPGVQYWLSGDCD